MPGGGGGATDQLDYEANCSTPAEIKPVGEKAFKSLIRGTVAVTIFKQSISYLDADSINVLFWVSIENAVVNFSKFL